MKTFFNHNLIVKLVKNSAIQVPGVKKVSVVLENIKDDKDEIDVDAWFDHKIYNVNSVCNELQKKIFFNLSKQLDNTRLKINIIAHA